MANPQQPELRRSGRVPALDPDASESRLSAQDRPADGRDVGDVPQDQEPGHHPEQEQDKPDLESFAKRLGVAAEGDEPRGAPNVTGADSVGNRWQPKWRKIVVPAAVVVVVAAVGVLRRRR